MINRMDVYELCVRENYFTGGSTTAYEKMFECVDKGLGIGTIAAIIYCCSDETANLQTIREQLLAIQSKK